MCVACALTLASSARTYYVDAQNGNDANNGISPSAAFQTLEKVNALQLIAGDSILLASGQTFKGTLKLDNVSGEASNFIMVASTGKQKAIIDGKGCSAALSILSSRFITVKNLELTADGGAPAKGGNNRPKNRYGLYFDTPVPGDYGNLVFEDLYIHDVYFNNKSYVRPRLGKKQLKKKGHFNYGWGARLNCKEGSTLKNVVFRNCTVERVAHSGIRLTYFPIDCKVLGMENIQILDCRLKDIGGPGVVVSAAENIIIRGCNTLRTGTLGDSRGRGQGTGIWGFNMQNAVIENNTVVGAQGRGDAAGIHIDSYSKQVLVQYNLSMRNTGAFVHVVGGVRNSTYRYNVSVNDGDRRKGGINKNHVDGYIFRLFGHVLPGVPKQGPFNVYVYNNTIYTDDTFKDNVFIIEETVKGALFANNIVYTENDIIHNREKSDIAELADAQKDNLVFFQNNLYRKKYSWMRDPFTVTDPVTADPQFANAGGDEIKDYIPKNRSACSKGIKIEKLPGDKQGLIGGFDLEYDILGNKIDPAKPFIGAIRPKGL